ncbi:MAG: alpha/beta hydrolase [Pseudomonadota bacterium]
MPVTTANSVSIAYEQHGATDGEHLVLIQGLGMPLTAWPQDFIDYFVGLGMRVTVFDNRDIGQSQMMSGPGKVGFLYQLIKSQLGLSVTSPYSLNDMAEDTASLMDALGIESAHIVGISMGGMIAQLLAIEHGERVRSLTAIMSTSAEKGLPGPTKEVSRQLLSRPESAEMADRIAFGVKTWRLIGSKAFPRDQAELEDFLRRNYERGSPAPGIMRQMLAIAAAPDRVSKLKSLTIPTLVLHGENDPLVPVECGRSIAGAVPDAKIRTFPGMGHDLPRQLLPELLQEISAHQRQLV